MFLRNTSAAIRFPLVAQSHGHVIFDVGAVGTVGRPVDNSGLDNDATALNSLFGSDGLASALFRISCYVGRKTEAIAPRPPPSPFEDIDR